MLLSNKISSNKTILWLSLLVGVLIIYPNIGMTYHEVSKLYYHGETLSCISAFGFYFVYRYAFFVALCYFLARFDIKKSMTFSIQNVAWKSFLITAGAYVIYVSIAFTLRWAAWFEWLTGLVIMQFLIVWIIPLFVGYIGKLYSDQLKSQEEIEQLRTENLKSQCQALTNQINPHFFFNSLNGLSSLARSGKNAETVAYIGKLSEVFRYILQSSNKAIVELSEELKFMDAYRYLIELRYKGKLFFDIQISDEEKRLRIPVLSLLPLIENVVKHNRIDSEHIMTVSLSINEHDELLFSNPICCKLEPEESNGIGLKNVASRLKLQLGTEMRVENDGKTFRIILPLKH